jgi:hypothetical protein
MGQVSRRTLLARAGIGTGAGVFALLGATAAPAFRAASTTDLANVRLVCAAKRVAINWDTQWVNTPAAVADSTEADTIRAVRKQEQRHYATLAPLLNGTAPSDDDYTFTFPKGALRSPDLAVAFAVDLETMMLGLVVGAAERTVDPDVSATLTSIVAADGQHLSALSVLGGGSGLVDGLPPGLGIEDAGNQLAPFLSN